MRSSAAALVKGSLAKIPLERAKDKKPESSFDDCVMAIEYLNHLTGSKLRTGNVESIQLLSKLFSRGYTLPQVMVVIQVKVNEWNEVPVMKKYLRPSTLFNFSNFKTYHNEISK